MKRVLLLLLLSLFAIHPLQASHFEECQLCGWAFTKEGKKVHYEVRVAYNPKAEYVHEILSLEVMLGKKKIVFPKKAFDRLSLVGTPRELDGSPLDSREFSLYFSCGDGAKCYTLDFIMRDGRLVRREITPYGLSEVWDQLQIYNTQGRLIYDGPCDRQGHPTRAVEHTGIDTPR